MDFVALGLFWALALYGLWRGGPLLIYLFFISLAFGSFAVIPGQFSGVVSVTALPVMGLFLVLQTLGSPANLGFFISAATRANQLGILTIFWLVAVLTTLIMPRLFEGQVTVVPMRYLNDANQPLAPSTQNFTQISYLTVSVLTVFAFARITQTPAGRRLLINGIFVAALALIVTGLLDLLSQYIPLTPLLDAFRTANYTLRVEDEVLGSKRIVGLMSEASVYGEFCVTMLATLYFLRHALPDRTRWRRWLWPILAVLFLFTYLSTSSAAYVGLGVFVGLAALEWLWRVTFGMRDRRNRQSLIREFSAVAIACLVLVLVGLMAPRVFDPVTEMVTELVFNKTSSSSFEERSLWTAVSLQAAFDSYGLGVGVGATRASSSFVSGLSNFGMLGGGLYIIFVLQCYLQGAPRGDKAGAWILGAFRWAMVAPTVVGWLIATSPDFGCFRAALYGAMIAIGQSARRQEVDVGSPRPNAAVRMA